MDERQAFLLALLDDPSEANRLVFADWLDDHGEGEAARRFREAGGPVGVAWAVIHDWLARRHPTMLSLFFGPADDIAFDRLEERLGQELPEDFKASYRIHDGADDLSGVLIGEPLLGLEWIGDAWQEEYSFCGTDEPGNGAPAAPHGPVKSLSGSRGCVPFAGSISHDHLALDLDPGPGGRVGQVILVCGSPAEGRHVIAGSFADFLLLVARQFALGRVCLRVDQSPDDPHWLALDWGMRRLLTGLRESLDLESPR